MKASVIMGELSVRIVVPMDMKKLRQSVIVSELDGGRRLYGPAYPNVAADPSIYWPSVRIMPLGPGPNLMMLVAPKMKPMIKPTAGQVHQRLVRGS